MQLNVPELHDLENIPKSEAVTICLNIISELQKENQNLKNKLILSKTNLTTIQTRINHLMDSYNI